MFANITDHPGIANALRTGYPTQLKKELCRKCGEPAECYGDTSGYLCFACAREEFDDMGDEEAVEPLGFEVL